MSVQIQLRKGTAAAWTAANPTLADGEVGFEEDTGKIKIGTGLLAWNALAYGPAIDGSGDRKDLLSALLVPGEGVNTIPATTGGGGSPTGAAGGSLAGTYPNPTLAGRDTSTDKLNQDMLPGELAAPVAGVSTVPAPSTTPSGAAGGSLAGTYPNPTLAGRDSSVDKINQDMLPAVLGDGASGVTNVPTQSPPTGAAGGSLTGTYPNPTLAGRDTSVDKLNQDMLPAVLGDGASGISTTPQTIPNGTAVRNYATRTWVRANFT